MKDLSRRDFFKGAAVASVGAATLGLATEAIASPVAGGADWMPAWDETTDVIVMGFGGAGGSAAMAAKQAGAEVIVFEKSHLADGGSTGCASGNLHTAPKSDPNEWIPKVIEGCYGTTDEETIRKMVAHAMDTPDYMESIGMNMEWVEARTNSLTRPSVSSPGRVVGYDGNEGRFLWAETLRAAEAMGIDYRLSTPVRDLIQNPVTKEILGVMVVDPSGAEKYIKASRGVVLACGGYGNSPWHQMNFNYPGIRLWPWGTINNTGDGIDLVCRVGAALWHMHGLEFSSVNYLQPSMVCGASISTDATIGIQPYNHIFVNTQGIRFMNEAKSMNHDIESKPVMNFLDSINGYVNMPFFMIFDDVMFNDRPLWAGSGRAGGGIINTYAGVQKLLTWGPDNSIALAEGWIFKGDTLAELAAQVKTKDLTGKDVTIDPAGLEATVAEWNEFVAAGEDGAFGRNPERMAPISTGPFYAIEMGLSNINTQGGARRNGDCQIVDTVGKPIGRLFGAGEFGSINGYVYVYGNIFEAYTSGMVAGQNAAAQAPWE